ncbi:pentapeptide repeat-containing protein [Nocardia sp. NPDC058658]|uniref:pentapeptide repeat-containing protein n=1 Tax=Nocardia sp. NPDC058658 TaxID=3346580 RepID=UPI00364A1534
MSAMIGTAKVVAARGSLVIVVVGAVVAAVWLLYQVPVWFAGNPKDAEPFRGSLVQLIGFGVAAAVAAYGIKKHYLDRDKQYTDSYSAAVTKLGSTDTFLRAGGARELARIMHYSPADRTRAVETYADFLRLTTCAAGYVAAAPPAPDIEAVVAALRRRDPVRGEPAINLTRVQLPHADLHGAPLTGVDLSHATLTAASLAGADLTRADLRGALLNKTDLTRATLAGADLTGARLIGADLRGADLTGADLTDCTLKAADLRGTDLRRTLGLRREQWDTAITDSATRAPEFDDPE